MMNYEPNSLFGIYRNRNVTFWIIYKGRDRNSVFVLYLYIHRCVKTSIIYYSFDAQDH